MPATHNQTINSIKKISGFSLIELMIAISIAFLVISVMVTVYLSSQKTLALQLALNNMQNHSQKAYYIFKRALERTGRLSCYSLAHDVKLFYPPYVLTSQNMISGSANELIVRYVDYPGSSLLKPIDNQALLSVDLSQRFSPQDILVISDCHHAEMFQAKAVSSERYQQSITTDKPLQYHYEKHAEVGRFVIDHFVIKSTQRFYKDGSRIKALFVANQHRTDELIEEVESMNISFRAGMNGIGIHLHFKSDHIRKVFHYYFSLRESHA